MDIHSFSLPTPPRKDPQVSQFLQSMQSGHTWSRIAILQIPNYYDAIVQRLIDGGLSGKELVKEVTDSLRGICPLCGTWADSATLAGPSSIRDFGPDNTIIFTDSPGGGPLTRLLAGHCQHANCSSEDILLIWKDHPAIRSHIGSVLQRLDAELAADSPIHKFLRHDTIAYTVDAVFNLTLEFRVGHFYSGHRFSDIFVWVSVIPRVADPTDLLGGRRPFAGGYLAFFDQLLRESAHDSGEMAVMHWVYVADLKNPLLHLAFLADRHHASEGHILPMDLLSEGERKQLGLV